MGPNATPRTWGSAPSPAQRASVAKGSGSPRRAASERCHRAASSPSPSTRAREASAWAWALANSSKRNDGNDSSPRSSRRLTPRTNRRRAAPPAAANRDRWRRRAEGSRGRPSASARPSRAERSSEMPKVRALTSARTTVSQLFGARESSTAVPAISHTGPSPSDEPSMRTVASASIGSSAREDAPSSSAVCTKARSLSRAARSTARSKAPGNAEPTMPERASSASDGTLSPRAIARTTRTRAS